MTEDERELCWIQEERGSSQPSTLDDFGPKQAMSGLCVVSPIIFGYIELPLCFPFFYTTCTTSLQRLLGTILGVVYGPMCPYILSCPSDFVSSLSSIRFYPIRFWGLNDTTLFQPGMNISYVRTRLVFKSRCDEKLGPEEQMTIQTFVTLNTSNMS